MQTYGNKKNIVDYIFWIVLIIFTNPGGILEALGLADGCKLLKDIPKDGVIAFDDVELPSNKLCNKLWLEKKELFKII